MSLWTTNGPILIRVDDGASDPRWINPAVIEQVRSVTETPGNHATRVYFLSGLTADFRMPMDAFFERLAEAAQAKYG